MTISIPELSLVVLIGPNGSEKSTFARKHFQSEEVMCPHHCPRPGGNAEDHHGSVSLRVNEVRERVSQRLGRGQLTVVDACSTHPDERRDWVRLAKSCDCAAVAIVFNIPERVCEEGHHARDSGAVRAHLINERWLPLRRSIKDLDREGFRDVFVMNSPEEVEAVHVERMSLPSDLKGEHGPFDIIGDIHGCCDELEELLLELGYRHEMFAPGGPALVSGPIFVHPAGRKVIFVGDLVDRGPRILDTLRLVAGMVSFGSALCVPGNHDMKLLRKLKGKNPHLTHGFALTVAEIDALPDGVREIFCQELAVFLEGLVSHYGLDGGRLVVAHAGIKEEYQGRDSGRVREFALYGETTGETDEYGLPVRLDWAVNYRGSALVVYGHTPVAKPKWLNGTVNIDTGCVFGGSLTALRYPEGECVSVKAKRVYCAPARPFLADAKE